MKPPPFPLLPLRDGQADRLRLGDFPTSVEPLRGLCGRLGRDDLFVKRDDLSAEIYGGNKVRKLEYLLADARAHGARRVITSGAAGSNHALATAIHAKRAGFGVTLILFDQPPAPAVRDNLCMDAAVGAEMIHGEDYGAYDAMVEGIVRRYTASEGVAPYCIPFGGSSPVGVRGYVAAGFELHGQILSGAIREPSVIVIAMGSMGSAAGLLLGLRAAGVKSEVVAVRVTPQPLAGPGPFGALLRATNDLLREKDPAFPDLSAAAGDGFTICHDYYEPGYGIPSDAVREAVIIAVESDGVSLDHTYSGKAFAAFLDEAKKMRREPAGPLLFWNTKNSRKFPEEMLAEGRAKLPEDFRKYLSKII